MNQYELTRVSVKLVKDSPIISKEKINTPKDAVKVLQSILRELDREILCLVNVKTDGAPINCNFVSVGTVNSASFSMKEILKPVILSNAAGVIILHNHLGENVLPSKEDIIATGRISKALKLFEIPLMDHIIVGADNDNIYSFLEREVLPVENLNYYEFIHFSLKEENRNIIEERER